MTKTELKVRLELHQRELRVLEGIKVECASCVSWFRPVCTKYNQEPPPEVKAEGCDDWFHDFIPF